MAAASTADLQPVPASAKPPAPPDTGIAPPDTSKVEGDFGGIEGALKGLASGMEAVDARTAKANQTIEDRIANLKMPQLELTPPPTVKQTEPVRVWSSNAMLFAGLASLLTRRPLLTAMRAAAGVVNAYRAGDQAAADAAFKTWKVSQDNAIKLADFQMEQYKAILNEADRAERLNDQEALRADRALQAEFNATATAFRDDIAIQTLKERGWDETQRLMVERQRLMDQMQANYPKLIESNAFQSAYLALQKDPAFQHSNPLQQYRMIRGLIDKTAPGLDTHGDGSPKDIAAATKVYNEDLKLYPKDPLSGQPKGAPNFDEWYETVWPVWGHADDPTVYGYRAGGGHFASGHLPPNTSQAMQFFMSKGWSNAAASGIVGSLIEESGLQANPPGDNDGGKAWGVAQWHGDRRTTFQQLYGFPIEKATLEQQLEYVNWELTQGPYKAVGDRLRTMANAGETGGFVSTYYESPRDTAGAAKSRSALAQRIAGHTGGSGLKPIPVPPAYANAADGIQLQKDGVIWVKHGGQLIPQA